jgi:hypothetical protein
MKQGRGVLLFCLNGARGRNRTGTGVTSRGILSPLRLPIPPPGHCMWISETRRLNIAVLNVLVSAINKG